MRSSEEKLREDWHSLTFKQAFKNPNPLLLVNDEGLVQLHNPAAGEIVTHWSKSGQSSTLCPFSDSIQTVLQTKQNLEIKTEVGGSLANFELSPSPCGTGVFINGKRKKASQQLSFYGIEVLDAVQVYLDVARVIITVLKVDGTIQLINKLGCEILGYQDVELIGKNWYDHCLPRSESEKVKSYAKLIYSGEVESIQDYKSQIITKSGEIKSVSWHNNVLRNKAGEIIGFISSGTDITGQLATETRLKEQDQKYREMFEANMAVKLVIDPENGQIVDANPAAVSFYGYSKKEICLKKISEINTLTPEAVAKEMAWAKEKRRLYFNFKHLTARGEIKDVEVYSGPFLIEGKTYLYSIIHDVTEKRMVEERYQATFNLAAVGIAHFDLSGKLLMANPYCHKLLGYSESEMAELPFQELTHPEDIDALRTQFKQLIDKKHHSFQIEQRYLKKGGKELWVDLSVTLVEQNGSSPPHYIFIIKDASEIKRNLEALATSEKMLTQAKERAEAASNAKSRFLAIMSHELRTPLNGVLGVAQVLQLELEDDPENSELVDLIIDSGNSLLDIVQDVLNFTKIESQKFEVRNKLFSPQQLMQRLRKLFVSATAEKNLTLSLKLDPSLKAQLFGASTTIEQAMSNLIANAVKFTKVGNIELAVEVVKSEPTFQVIGFKVTDTGIGIENKDMTRICEPFSQADESSTRNYEGAGLGLTISKRLIHIIGGELQIKSKLGQGSCFSFEVSLPYQG